MSNFQVFTKYNCSSPSKNGSWWNFKKFQKNLKYLSSIVVSNLFFFH
jgi:hypothetical protein